MTSSLVGSEMCIRDSRRTRCSTWPSTMSYAASVHSRRSVWPPSTNRTVSYTHLTLPTICSV
eukprot:11450659-Prorocentrum_lima.AAC.1